ncbi:hypothetical protein PLESTF_001858200 [Pleodorina starrii]|nr:hypothetical protein PLESTF_001858200 [Pleodorina starrii]
MDPAEASLAAAACCWPEVAPTASRARSGSGSLWNLIAADLAAAATAQAPDLAADAESSAAAEGISVLLPLPPLPLPLLPDATGAAAEKDNDDDDFWDSVVASALSDDELLSPPPSQQQQEQEEPLPSFDGIDDNLFLTSVAAPAAAAAAAAAAAKLLFPAATAPAACMPQQQAAQLPPPPPPPLLAAAGGFGALPARFTAAAGDMHRCLWNNTQLGAVPGGGAARPYGDVSGGGGGGGCLLGSAGGISGGDSGFAGPSSSGGGGGGGANSGILSSSLSSPAGTFLGAADSEMSGSLAAVWNLRQQQRYPCPPSQQPYLMPYLMPPPPPPMQQLSYPTPPLTVQPPHETQPWQHQPSLQQQPAPQCVAQPAAAAAGADGDAGAAASAALTRAEALAVELGLLSGRRAKQADDTVLEIGWRLMMATEWQMHDTWLERQPGGRDDVPYAFITRPGPEGAQTNMGGHSTSGRRATHLASRGLPGWYVLCVSGTRCAHASPPVCCMHRSGSCRKRRHNAYDLVMSYHLACEQPPPEDTGVRCQPRSCTFRVAEPPAAGSSSSRAGHSSSSRSRQERQLHVVLEPVLWHVKGRVWL